MSRHRTLLQMAITVSLIVYILLFFHLNCRCRLSAVVRWKTTELNFCQSLSTSDYSIYGQVIQRQEISLKKLYDEMIEDIFDMSNVRIFKEIQKKKCWIRDLFHVYLNRFEFQFL